MRGGVGVGNESTVRQGCANLAFDLKFNFRCLKQYFTSRYFTIANILLGILERTVIFFAHDSS